MYCKEDNYSHGSEPKPDFIYALYIFLVNYILVANSYSVILYSTDKNCHLFSKVLKSEDDVAPCHLCKMPKNTNYANKQQTPESVSAQQPFKLCAASKAKTKKRKKWCLKEEEESAGWGHCTLDLSSSVNDFAAQRVWVWEVVFALVQCGGKSPKKYLPRVQLQTCEAQSHYVGGHVCCHWGKVLSNISKALKTYCSSFTKDIFEVAPLMPRQI